MPSHIKQKAAAAVDKRWVMVNKPVDHAEAGIVASEQQQQHCVYTRDLMLLAMEKHLNASKAFRRKASAESTDDAESTVSPGSTHCSDDESVYDLLPRTRSSTCDEDFPGGYKPTRRFASKTDAGGRSRGNSGSVDRGRPRTMSDTTTSRKTISADTVVAAEWSGHRQRAESWHGGYATSPIFLPYAYPASLWSPWPQGFSPQAPVVQGTRKLSADAPEFKPECTERLTPTATCTLPGEDDALVASDGEKANSGQAILLRTQVEHYFSVANIGHDVFLRSLMDARGWVPIDRLLQFPKLRRMMVDVHVVAAALRDSAHVAVSRDGRRVRIKNVHLRQSYPSVDLMVSPGTFMRTYNPDVPPIMELPASAFELADEANRSDRADMRSTDCSEGKFSTALTTVGSDGALTSRGTKREKRALVEQVHAVKGAKTSVGKKITRSGRISRVVKPHKAKRARKRISN